MKPVVIEEKCIGCEMCYRICPSTPKVMKMEETEKGKKAVIVNPESCDFRAACVRSCPTGAFLLIDE